MIDDTLLLKYKKKMLYMTLIQYMWESNIIAMKKYIHIYIYIYIYIYMYIYIYWYISVLSHNIHI